MTRRQQIIDALTALLIAGIPAVAGRVSVWRTFPLDEDLELPALSLKDTTVEISEEVIGYADHLLTIGIVALAQGTDAVTVVRDLAAAAFASIGTDPTLGGLVDRSTPAGVDIDTETGNYIFAFANIRITFFYRTPLWEL